MALIQSTKARSPADIDMKFLRILELFENGAVRLEDVNRQTEDLIDEWTECLKDEEIVKLYVKHFCIDRHLPMRLMIGHIEKIIISRALIKMHGNQSKAARFLGIDTSTLSKKIHQYRIIAIRKNSNI